MSARASLWCLWAVFLVAVPIPFFLVETGSAPAIRLIMLTSATLWLIAVEGAQGAVATIAGLLAIQTLAGMAVLFLVAAAASRASRNWAPGARALATSAIVATVLVASAFEIYQTPFRTSSLVGSIFEVLE